jgi:hypothetical protein
LLIKADVSVSTAQHMNFIWILILTKIVKQLLDNQEIWTRTEYLKIMRTVNFSLGAWVRISLASPDWPQTLYPPASASWALGIQEYTITPSSGLLIF